MKADLTAAAEKNGRSVSEEVEYRLAQSFIVPDYIERAKAALNANTIQAIRLAGWQIVREGGGKVTVNVSPELLLAEADGILRTGFIAVEDLSKSPTEIMVKRAVAEGVAEALERVGIPSAGVGKAGTGKAA
jgi:hypothetical protein